MLDSPAYVLLAQVESHAHEAKQHRLNADLPHAPAVLDRLRASLEHIAEARERLDQVERDTVVRLRAAGASWSTVGACLGISKQAAAQRFGYGRASAPEPGASLVDVLEGRA